MAGDQFVYSGHDELLAMKVMENYNDNIVRIIKSCIENTEKVVDFGAGVGTIADKLRDVAEVECIEIEERQRNIVNAKGFKSYADIDQLEPNSVTFLYSSNVLEHIEDDYGAVARIYDRIRRDGRVVFYVPAFQMLYTSNDARVGHVRRYDRKRLRDVFQRAGFKVEKLFYADVLGILAVFLYKAAGSDDGRLDLGQLRAYDRFVFPISKALDLLFCRLVGKNLVLVARK